MYLTLLRHWVYLFILLPLACFAQGAEEVLIPSADGTQIKVQVRHPTGLDISQPRPVVLALHGCGGLYATIGHKYL